MSSLVSVWMFLNSASSLALKMFLKFSRLPMTIATSVLTCLYSLYLHETFLELLRDSSNFLSLVFILQKRYSESRKQWNRTLKLVEGNIQRRKKH